LILALQIEITLTGMAIVLEGSQRLSELQGTEIHRDGLVLQPHVSCEEKKPFCATSLSHCQSQTILVIGVDSHARWDIPTTVDQQ
jgi:hypothetical protein